MDPKNQEEKMAVDKADPKETHHKYDKIESDKESPVEK